MLRHAKLRDTALGVVGSGGIAFGVKMYCCCAQPHKQAIIERKRSKSNCKQVSHLRKSEASSQRQYIKIYVKRKQETNKSHAQATTNVTHKSTDSGLKL